MNWTVASRVPSWGAAADQGPTMVSFSSAGPTTEINLQDFSVGLVGQRARPARAGRRSRVVGAGIPEMCSVDGCPSDLSRCREYYRRHKVCEAHSKTTVVLVVGQEQRFCQQCSRKRLDRHNRRRRQPQYDVMNLRGFFPYQQVNQFSVCPQSTPKSRQNYESMHLVDHQQTFSISFSETVKAPKQFPFSQDEDGIPNPFHPNILLAEHDGRTRSRDVSGTLSPECALSLLSSSLHRPSPITDQAQQETSSHAFQDARTLSVAYASGIAPDALFDDPL